MKTEESTMLEAVQESLSQAARYNPGEAVRPAAVLWTDAERQWEPVVAQLKNVLPALLTLGDYDPDQKLGPAIWLRCMVERTLPDNKLPDDEIIVIYMPGVSRQSLRAVEECPQSLQPLVELQYRGTVWKQRNGKDWTVEAFLLSQDGGVGLDVSRDRETRQAALGSLSHLSVTPVARLRGKRLEAEDFDKLMVDDTTRDLLQWLSDSEGTKQQWDSAKWNAFCSRCREEYSFDPESDGELAAAEKLGVREKGWDPVWQRFREAPKLYSGIPELLKRAKPSKLLFEKEPWPDENQKAEKQLQNALKDLQGKVPADARKRIVELEKEHGNRRDWVWAKMGWCVMAQALEHLAVLAKETENNLCGNNPAEIANEYVQHGYFADDSALKMLGAVKTDEQYEAITTAINAVYADWLDAAATKLQESISESGLPCAEDIDSIPQCEPSECILFVDGLRYDLAMRLKQSLEGKEYKAEASWRWAALPTVTATAKPAVSPAMRELTGKEAAPNFAPLIENEGVELNQDRFHNLLEKAGYEILRDNETGNPVENAKAAWCEYGEFDKLGHSLQKKMAARVDEQLDLVVDRVKQLLNAGWQSVNIVTDHGWLLLPGGLPVKRMPHYLAKTRWSRCAVVKESAQSEDLAMPWFWNKEELIAYCPGSHVYFAGRDYSHGGISPQECIVPELTVVGGATMQAADVTIGEIQWRGLRCRVEVEPHKKGILVGMRTKANDDSSAVAETKEIDSSGKASLLVTDEDLEGVSASIVLLNSQGRLLKKKPTIVGGE